MYVLQHKQYFTYNLESNKVVIKYNGDFLQPVIQV